MQAATRARDRVPPFFRALQEFGQQHASGRSDYDERIMINRAMRVQPDWADIESSWFETEELLESVTGIVGDLHDMLHAGGPGERARSRRASPRRRRAATMTGEQLRAGHLAASSARTTATRSAG